MGDIGETAAVLETLTDEQREAVYDWLCDEGDDSDYMASYLWLRAFIKRAPA